MVFLLLHVAIPFVVTADSVGVWIGIVVGLGAIATGLYRAWRWSVKTSNLFDDLARLVNHELTNNSGSSMKDKIEKSLEGVDEIKVQLKEHMETSAATHTAMWQAINGGPHGPHSISTNTAA